MADLLLHLDRSLDMPGRARAFVERQLSVVPPGVCQDVVLLVSELVTNVVRHGELPAHLSLAVSAESVRVRVHDSGPDVPVAAAPADAGRSSGRGLLIVAALSQVWGVSPDDAGGGKDVWFEVPVPVPVRGQGLGPAADTASRRRGQ